MVYDFVLCALFDHEPMKQFECRSDRNLLRSAMMAQASAF